VNDFFAGKKIKSTSRILLKMSATCEYLYQLVTSGGYTSFFLEADVFHCTGFMKEMIQRPNSPPAQAVVFAGDAGSRVFVVHGKMLPPGAPSSYVYYPADTPLEDLAGKNPFGWFTERIHERTRTFFSLDTPLLRPESPSELLARGGTR
jgi:hypothetical protein